MTLQRIINIALLASTLTVFGKGAVAAEYEIDIPGMHAAIQFRIYHLGYSVLTGRFNDFSGSFNWDKDQPEASSINVTINTASIDSNHAERDKHLREADFLNVEEYPEATFKSTKYNGDANGGTLEGILTLHGVSKPIAIDVKFIGEGDDPWGGYRAGFEGNVTLRRSDFGMTYDLGPKSDEMELDLYIEGCRDTCQK
ncbi:MAG: YceI family protein [Gammaproteobacteria bacterium]|nr:YceI family protein [Gammaproteobacteria bacterium]